MTGSQDIALLGTGLETVAGVGSSLTQAAAMRAQGRYEAERLRQGARFADLEAEDVLRQGDRAASVRAREGDVLEGRMLAAQAAQGIDVSSGSAAHVRESALASSDLDVEAIRMGAYRRAWGVRRDAEELRAAAAAAQSRAKFGSRVTASTAGYRLAKGMLDVSELWPGDYTAPPAGKNMSDPRNR
ncbi:MAG TPA: hypothetical protein VFT32_13095 [Candidatus Eisenbacteria bacterium]|nr:hypothetical protein [Candidatus Eisenbacteria bacterium]